MAHEVRGWLQYGSDPVPFAGVNFSLKADITTATNNGQSLSTSPLILNFWPSHTSDLRHGYGVEASTGRRDSCIATSTGSPVYTIGANFSDRFGNSYTVIGIRPEHLRTRNLK